MYIEKLTIEGFLDRPEIFQANFHDDINIVTGFNGAGKTNFLKLIWYTISGNIKILLEEVTFKTLELKTSEYTVFLRKHSHNTCSGWFESKNKRSEFEDLFEGDDDEREVIFDARDGFSDKLEEQGASLFFPTFRRIEGGFSIRGTGRKSGSRLRLWQFAQTESSDLQKAILDVSEKLSTKGHNFVTSISTVDISALLVRRFSDLTEQSSRFQSKTTQNIISEIRDFRQEQSLDGDEGSEASQVLDSIATKIEQIDARKDRLMAPFDAVRTLVAKIFKHKAIQIDARLSFGDAAEAISSDLLSAGEKQMLSFICYNAFYENLPIFVDEPELSLHVDWQRTLFPTLESQGTSNQFIIATHSPFIYSKYPEKEIKLAPLRGDEKLVD